MELFLEDSTLREGEQSPGVAFSVKEKLKIAEMLENIGVTALEVGTPAMGGVEEEAITELVRADFKIKLIGWNRGRKTDLEKSFACGLDSVHIGLPSSDHHLEKKFKKSRDWVIEQMQELIFYAKSRGAWVSVSAEDAGRADPDFLVSYAGKAKDAGADRLRLSDTVGVLDPFRAYTTIKRVVDEVGIPVQVHMHNDFGLATANTLAGVKAGASHVHFTVNGLGERAGLAPLEEVIMGLKFHCGCDLPVKTEYLTAISRYVAEASNRPIPVNKPIVGSSIFEHESGIHVDGVLKVADAFEPFAPELIGASRSIIIGKHSGSNAVQYILQQAGYETERSELTEVVTAIRQAATDRKRGLDIEEVVNIYKVWKKG